MSVPLWGDRYVKIFCRAGLPSIISAARRISGEVTLLLHTTKNEFDYIGRHAEGLAMEYQPVSRHHEWWRAMSDGHRYALGSAQGETGVILLTADMVISCEMIAASQEHLSRNKRVVCGASIRALDTAELPSGELSGAQLVSWAWQNLHPITAAAIYPNGRSDDVARLYFQHERNVVCRLVMPHPFAVRPEGRRLDFKPTIDAWLYTRFNIDEIHVVTNPAECSGIELSPPDKEFKTGATLEERLAPGGIWARHQPSVRWMLGHRILLCGHADDECGDIQVADRLLDISLAPSPSVLRSRRR